MARAFVSAITAFLLMAGVSLAADKEVKGTIVKVDAAKKTITVKVEKESKEFEVNDETKFIGPKGGVSADGIKDARLVKGVAVKLLVAGNNRTVREVHIPAATEKKPAAPKKAETSAPATTKTAPPAKPAPVATKPAPAKPAAPAVTKAAPTTPAPAKTPVPAVTKAAPTKPAPATKPAPSVARVTPPAKPADPTKSTVVNKVPESTKAPAKKPAALKPIPANAKIGTTAADAPGTKAKIVKVDAEKKTLVVTTEDGKQMEVQTDAETSFIGPRGGISDYRLKDDRLTVGYEVRLVMSGKSVKEVHMSYRPRKATDK